MRATIDRPATDAEICQTAPATQPAILPQGTRRCRRLRSARSTPARHHRSASIRRRAPPRRPLAHGPRAINVPHRPRQSWLHAISGSTRSLRTVSAAMCVPMPSSTDLAGHCSHDCMPHLAQEFSARAPPARVPRRTRAIGDGPRSPRQSWLHATSGSTQGLRTVNATKCRPGAETHSRSPTVIA